MPWVPPVVHMTIAILSVTPNLYPEFWRKKIPLVDKGLL